MASRVQARRRLTEFVVRFEKTAAKAVACIEAGFADAMAVMALPEKYRRRLRSTNMQERLNEEIRSRERVIRIFQNDESALRLIGAPLVGWEPSVIDRIEEKLQQILDLTRPSVQTRPGQSHLALRAKAEQ